jgi:hypothetical protein
VALLSWASRAGTGSVVVFECRSRRSPARGPCPRDPLPRRRCCPSPASIYEHDHRLVRGQVGAVDGDEIAAFTTALATPPDLRGVVVTADALHCHPEHARCCTPAAGTAVHPSRPVSRPCDEPWPGCPRFRSPALGVGNAGTGGL